MRHPSSSARGARRLLALAWVLLGSAAAGLAQISLDARLLHTQLMQFEPVLATVSVENMTAEPLDLSGREGKARLYFDIEQAPGDRLTPQAEHPFPEVVAVPPHERISKQLDLRPLYPLRRPGNYTLRARLEWMNKAFTSTKVFFDVVPGLELAKFITETVGPEPKLLNLTLRSLNRETGEWIFLRVDDENTAQCLGVFQLGKLVQFFTPQLRMDKLGSIHVLHQSGPSQFIHSVFSPDGVPVEQAGYTGDASSIRLDPDVEGRLRVAGGRLNRPESPPPRP